MQKHQKFLIGGLFTLLLVSTVVPALAATNRGDVIAAADRIISTLNTLIDDQGDIADRIDKLKIAGSTSDRSAIASDVREMTAKLENLQEEIDDMRNKINNLKLARPSSIKNSEDEMLRVSCVVSNLRPKTGQTITYTANVIGGSSEGVTYRWSGDFTGVSKVEKFIFSSAGIFNAKISVENSSGETASAECPKVIVSADTTTKSSGANRTTGASITVTGPADGSSMTIGKQGTFSWKHRGLYVDERLNISLKSTTGTQYFVRTSQMQGNNGTGSYIWPSVGTAPNSFVPSGAYTLQICTTDGVICGVSSMTIKES